MDNIKACNTLIHWYEYFGMIWWHFLDWQDRLTQRRPQQNVFLRSSPDRLSIHTPGIFGCAVYHHAVKANAAKLLASDSQNPAPLQKPHTACGGFEQTHAQPLPNSTLIKSLAARYEPCYTTVCFCENQCCLAECGAFRLHAPRVHQRPFPAKSRLFKFSDVACKPSWTTLSTFGPIH